MTQARLQPGWYFHFLFPLCLKLKWPIKSLPAKWKWVFIGVFAKHCDGVSVHTKLLFWFSSFAWIFAMVIKKRNSDSNRNTVDKVYVLEAESHYFTKWTKRLEKKRKRLCSKQLTSKTRSSHSAMGYRAIVESRSESEDKGVNKLTQ